MSILRAFVEALAEISRRDKSDQQQTERGSQICALLLRAYRFLPEIQCLVAKYILTICDCINSVRIYLKEISQFLEMGGDMARCIKIEYSLMQPMMAFRSMTIQECIEVWPAGKDFEKPLHELYKVTTPYPTYSSST